MSDGLGYVDDPELVPLAVGAGACWATLIFGAQMIGNASEAWENIDGSLDGEK